VAFGFYLGEDAGDLAFTVDNEGGALDPQELLAVHALLFHDAVSGADFLVGVGEERVGKVVLLLEFLLLFRAVGGDAEYDSAGLEYLLECVAEPARFYRSTGSVGLGIKEQNHVLAFKIV
jgi:hypothetical protein